MTEEQEATQAEDGPFPFEAPDEPTGMLRENHLETKIKATEKPEAQPEENPKQALAVTQGQANPSSVEQQFRLAKLYFSSKMLPNRFTSPEQVLTAMHFAAEHFPKTPLTALRQIAMVNGVPHMFGDLPLARVQCSGLLKNKNEYFIDKDQLEISLANKNIGSEVWGAVCTTWRRGGYSDQGHTTVFTMDDAKRAGLDGKDTWKKYPQDMLKYKARGRNLKDNFADALNGAGIGEHDHDMTIDMVRDERPVSLADELNATYLPKGVSE